jgi:hypothetical protein
VNRVYVASRSHYNLLAERRFDLARLELVPAFPEPSPVIARTAAESEAALEEESPALVESTL